jgi:hypothetical protein
VTDQPAHPRPTGLHQRLTVALANPANRATLVDVVREVAGPASVVVDRAALQHAAEGWAQQRGADRRALRARLDAVAARAMHDCDTARHQLEHLEGWQRTIVDGAAWATQLAEDLPRHLDAVEAVRAALDERRAEQRSAQQDLERVLEQRAAAAAAIEEADRELAEQSGSGMDETALRRELEASGRAVRDAEAAHQDALARLAELQLEATELDQRREAARLADEAPADRGDAGRVAAVRAALGALQDAMGFEIDPDAVALVEAWRDLQADLREVTGPLQDATEGELESARQRVVAAASRLAELDAAASASKIPVDQRAALDAAHAEVLAAEEQLMGRRRVTTGARRRLEEAHAAEQALLDRHGFSTYLDVVLSGGRAGATDPARLVAEREHFDATLAFEAVERSTRISPELAHLRSERARLAGMAQELLGVDPGNDVEALLEAHHAAPAEVRARLAEALDAVGVRPVGVSLEAAAGAFLDGQPEGAAEPVVELSAADRGAERAAIDERAAALEAEVHSAQAEVDRTAEALQLSRRSVDAFEGELSVRATEDVQRLKRFAAAEQLRAQIDTVAATLERAEHDARRTLAEADQAVAAAETTFDQAASEVSDLARNARKLAEELPIDQRPEGDPLRSLPLLAERLEAHASVIQPEIDKAEAATFAATLSLEEAMAACRAANVGGDEAQPEDITSAVQDLSGSGGELLVLDEPFEGLEDEHRAELLDLVRAASTHRPVVLVTEDPEVLGWAIELPAEEAVAVPADALLARFHRDGHGLNPKARTADASSTSASAVPDPAAPTRDSAPPDVDITSPTTIDTDHDAAPHDPRRVGRR